MSKSIAIIIHARVQSTRCPNKHLRDIGGTTLIDIAIDNVSKLTNVEEKYLAAYDNKLKSKAKGKIDILEREYEAVAPGNAHHSVMYKHLENVKADYIINYNPCQPFLDVDKLQQVIDWFKTSKDDSFITVSKTKNFYWNEHMLPANFKPGDRLSTTAGPFLYEATHSLVGYRKNYMLENWELFPNSINEPFAYIVDWSEEELIDVDTELDFRLVKEVYREKSKYTLDTWREAQNKHDKKNTESKKVLAIDFDGVIHKNSKGFYNGEVYDEPIEGALSAIKYLAEYYTIILYTFKGHPDRPLVRGMDGTQLTWEWLKKHGIDKYIEDIVWGKPNARVYIDDKGYRFENWTDTLKFIDERI